MSKLFLNITRSLDISLALKLTDKLKEVTEEHTVGNA